MALNDDGLGGAPMSDGDFEPAEGGAGVEGPFIPERIPEEPPAEDGPWYGAIEDEQLREYAAGKGYQSPADALQSAREAEKRMRQVEQEAHALKAQNEQAEDYLRRLMDQSLAGGGQQGNGGQQADPVTQGLIQLAQAYENGQIGTMAEYEAARMSLMAQRDQGLVDQVRQMMEEQFAERVHPIEDRFAHQDLTAAASEMRRMYPDTRVGERAMEILGDPREGLPSSGQGIRQAYRIAAGEIAQRASTEARRGARSETITGGGRNTPRREDAADAIRRAIAEVRTNPDDGL